ncbi:phosphoribosyltransferase [Tardibacter chloracetimidivorans]|uniref:Phosphoribosyltransferase n=1 Tax=Tardibacter chloracetimidivorans TaxID=1921510 RepID=A0A1L3ZRX2_9SPHN|nr:phosphoribosyltransferase [Tardibacter chloracetimidivorans]API58368.1 phosphoribosyltransferase [Tardibacter chloracetimidivorans]
MIFRDRQDAGQQLARRLRHLANEHPLVLALPRGGVPVAFEIATALKADLDLLFVRKLGAPGHEELGLGAVVDGADPQLVLNEDIVRDLAPSPNYLHAEMQRQLAEITRRREIYMHGIPPIDVARRTVILVDDGIATGGTVRAALKGLRKLGPARLILAVPVGPPDMLAKLRQECDELVCLAEPAPFFAVGAHYGYFDQTSDEEVVRLLQQARLEKAGSAAAR